MTVSVRCTDVLRMPELISSPYEVRMNPEEKKVYDQMKKELVLGLPDGEVTASNASALSGKLTQMANGAVYTDEGTAEVIHNRKLDALEDIIEEIAATRVTERGGRADDKRSETAMEDRKKAGYF